MRYDDHTREIVFRPHYSGYMAGLALVFGLGAATLALALRHHVGWLVGSALVIYGGAALVARYTAGTVIISGCDLVINRGTFTIRAWSIPLWEVRPIITQNLLGRMFDYGQFTVHIDGIPITVQVAQLRALRKLIATSRVRLLGLVEERALLHLSRPMPAQIEQTASSWAPGLD